MAWQRRSQNNPVYVLANSAALPRRTGGQRVARQGLERERVKGIEPSPKAWEAFVLPLNYTRAAMRKLATDTAMVKLPCRPLEQTQISAQKKRSAASRRLCQSRGHTEDFESVTLSGPGIDCTVIFRTEQQFDVAVQASQDDAAGFAVVVGRQQLVEFQVLAVADRCARL